MHTYLIGLLEEVRPIERKNKSTGEISISLDLTITFSSRDKDGYLIKSTQNVNFEDTRFKQEFDAMKGKYIAVPHVFINAKGGSYLFPDTKMEFLSFDKDPLISSKDTKKAS